MPVLLVMISTCWTEVYLSLPACESSRLFPYTFWHKMLASSHLAQGDHLAFFRQFDASRENVAQATELLLTLNYTSGRTD